LLFIARRYTIPERMKSPKAIINTDGGAEPNPGKAAIAAIIRDENGVLLASICQSIGHATNNQAEYRAVIAALEKAMSLGIKEVELRSDSELIVRQINGQYKVKKAELLPLYQKVKELQSRLTGFSIISIPREQNKEADALCSKAIR
jgi:ribonuclease HI